jgi:hypothetical protein
MRMTLGTASPRDLGVIHCAFFPACSLAMRRGESRRTSPGCRSYCQANEKPQRGVRIPAGARTCREGKYDFAIQAEPSARVNVLIYATVA